MVTPTGSVSLAQQVMAMRQAVLRDNAALRAVAEPTVAAPSGVPAGAEAPTGFANALQSAITQVNSAQAAATSMSEGYERGEVTDIAAVMLARQKASVGFEATLQVRNKLLSAYSDIMNMPL